VNSNTQRRKAYQTGLSSSRTNGVDRVAGTSGDEPTPRGCHVATAPAARACVVPVTSRARSWRPYNGGTVVEAVRRVDHPENNVNETLVRFLRGRTFNIYLHPGRIAA
jgi:hypothetical protein